MNCVNFSKSAMHGLFVVSHNHRRLFGAIVRVLTEKD